MKNQKIMLVLGIVFVVMFFVLGILSQQPIPAGLTKERVIAFAWVLFLNGIYLLMHYDKPSNPS